MFLPLLALASVVPTLYQDVSEYRFKNLKAAFVVNSRWRDILDLCPGLQLATSKETPPLTGSWILVDPSRNSVFYGSRDDWGERINQMFSAFDVKPIDIVTALTIERPDWGLKSRVQIETCNGESDGFSPSPMGASLTVRSRAQSDKTIIVTVTIQDESTKEKASCMARVDMNGSTLELAFGKAAIVKEKPLLESERVTNPPSGAIWKPFIIRLTSRAPSIN